MSQPMKKANELPQFTGPFQELIPAYISYKRAQGYKIGSPIVYRLREMDLFFKDRGIMDIQITREMYEKWTSHKPSEKSRTFRNGVPSYVVLPSTLYPVVILMFILDRMTTASLKRILSHMFSQMRKSAGYFVCCKGTAKNRLGMRMMLFGWRCCCIIAAVSENPRCLIS